MKSISRMSKNKLHALLDKSNPLLKRVALVTKRTKSYNAFSQEINQFMNHETRENSLKENAQRTLELLKRSHKIIEGQYALKGLYYQIDSVLYYDIGIDTTKI